MNLIKSGFVADKIQQRRELLAAGDKDEADRIKDTLPCMYMTAFTDTQAGASMHNDNQHTGVMVFDIDKIDLTKANEYRQLVISSPFSKYVLFMFTSPSNGLKIGIRTSYTTNPDFYKYCYKRLFEAFKKIGVDGGELDSKTCNANRTTYISHDPELVYTPDCKVMNLVKMKDQYNELEEQERLHRDEQQRKFEQVRSTGKYNEDKARRFADQDVMKIITKMGNGNRHNLIYPLCCAVFKNELTVYDAEQYLHQMTAAVGWPENMSQRAKAEECYKSWTMDKNKCMNPHVYDRDTEKGFIDLLAKLKAIPKPTR